MCKTSNSLVEKHFRNGKTFLFCSDSLHEYRNWRSRRRRGKKQNARSLCHAFTVTFILDFIQKIRANFSSDSVWVTLRLVIVMCVVFSSSHFSSTINKCTHKNEHYCLYINYINNIKGVHAGTIFMVCSIIWQEKNRQLCYDDKYNTYSRPFFLSPHYVFIRSFIVITSRFFPTAYSHRYHFYVMYIYLWKDTLPFKSKHIKVSHSWAFFPGYRQCLVFLVRVNFELDTQTKFFMNFFLKFGILIFFVWKKHSSFTMLYLNLEKLRNHFSPSICNLCFIA